MIPEQSAVDIVVVAYNSAATLHDCVSPLACTPGIGVTVVDNRSSHDPAEALTGLPVRLVHAERNRGFAAGSNLGIAVGRAPWVLLLNPDAQITPESIAALVTAGASDPRVAAVGPRILGEHGTLAFSQRRFARLRSTFSHALFLQRLAPLAEWSDEMVRDPALYELPGSPDWVSGACVLLRRDALEQVGGLDERYFLYREDMDLCLRLRRAGWEVRYEPGASARHIGGASSRPGETVPIFVASRMQYARAHFTPAGALLERLGVTLWACTHWLASVRRPDRRRGFAGALRRLTSPGSTHLVCAERQ